jgi:glycerol-3-phosphate acyltransferase PlsY
MVSFVLLAVLSYFAGSVNFSILLFRVLGKEDPRNHHSKNPGATNVYRQAGLFWAAVVLLLDVGRALVVGYAAVSLLAPEWVAFVGLALILGNRYPFFHGFDGGKGVANFLGFTLGLNPVAALISGIGWLGVFSFSRTPFVASFTMVTILAIGTVIRLGTQPAVLAGVLMTVGLIIYSHRSNIIEKWRSKP